MSFFESARSYPDALALALARIEPLAHTEELATTQALGRVLSEDVISPADLPGFARSGMDGYALRALSIQNASAQSPVDLTVIGRAPMGHEPASLPTVGRGEAIEIGTGGPLPPGADAVVMLEETQKISRQRIRVIAPAAAGTNVIGPDEDFKKGEIVYQAGHRLRPVDIGALLALEYRSVNVYRRVRVGVISTGDELVPAGTRRRPGQICEINSEILRAQISELGAESDFYGIIRDEREALWETIRRALAETDFVLLSGGSSVGAKDLTAQILEELGEILIHGLHLRPGKPTIFAICSDRPVVGLPGNPVSLAVVFHKFVAPLLIKRSGANAAPAPRLKGAVARQAIRSVKGRTDFLPVKLTQEGASAQIEPVRGHTTNISTLAKSDGLLFIDADAEGLAEGDATWVELW